MENIEGFFDKIIPEPNSGCWLWTASTKPNGYAQFVNNGKQRLAHRLSFEHFVEEIPEGKHVCHKCDVKCCVNPEHLFLGEHIDNMHDMISKGRDKKAFGNKHGNAKLKAEDVIEIRKSTMPSVKLAEIYGVSVRCISKIKTYDTWSHVK